MPDANSSLESRTIGLPSVDSTAYIPFTAWSMAKVRRASKRSLKGI